MTADSRDEFAYEPAREHTSAAARRHYWAVAIGLQATDGLEVSPYLRELANGYESGSYTLKDTGDLIRSYHQVGPSNSAVDQRPDTREADLVSQRIAEILAGSPFVMDAQMLKEIHRYLFQDLDCDTYRPGQFKTERMIKQEPILNGDSVLYADPYAYDMSLRMAFNSERAYEYGASLKGDDLKHFCHTIAFLWQVHPFAEGNTRTVAVFSELYLNHLGFAVGNEPFEHHSAYYRDALVRAMYRNAAAGIMSDDAYVIWFYDNMVNNAGHKLRREDTVCTALFEHPELLHNVDPAEALVPSRNEQSSH